jgi:hypothetical protein
MNDFGSFIVEIAEDNYNLTLEVTQVNYFVILTVEITDVNLNKVSYFVALKVKITNVNLTVEITDLNEVSYFVNYMVKITVMNLR